MPLGPVFRMASDQWQFSFCWPISLLPARFAHHCQCGDAASPVVDLGLPSCIHLLHAPTRRLLPSAKGRRLLQPCHRSQIWPVSSTLQELVGNRIQLNRLLGLSNLYYIDPEDKEILQELREVRLALIGAIEKCPEQQLESIWASDLGDRYWALVRSGLQKEPMTPEEEQKKHAATQKLDSSTGGGFGTPGAINAVLVAMTLFEPGTMRISIPEQNLPAWLLANYQQVFAESLSQQV